MNKNRLIIWLGLIIVLLTATPKVSRAQLYSVGTNLVGLATTSFNVEASMALSLKWTLHAPIQYNPWTYSGNKKIKNITFAPGARYWFLDSYGRGWFMGANALVSRYNVGGVVGMKYRYDGWAYGVGLSAGYSLPVLKRWNLEFEFGAAGVYYDHTKYACITCGDELGKYDGFFVAPNKLAVNLIYLF